MMIDSILDSELCLSTKLVSQNTEDEVQLSDVVSTKICLTRRREIPTIYFTLFLNFTYKEVSYIHHLLPSIQFIEMKFISGLLLSMLVVSTHGWNVNISNHIRTPPVTTSKPVSSLYAIQEPKTKNEQVNLDQTAEQYGLEAGLFKSMQQNDGGKSAKELLKKYGVAYLATSIPLAIVSFAICYALVDAGVDVAGLLAKIGIAVSDTNEKVGTFAIAYAAHKAASPIRFPPTVLLTPVVAKLIGKEPENVTDDGNE
jgi:hypothetical protein